MRSKCTSVYIMQNFNAFINIRIYIKKKKIMEALIPLPNYIVTTLAPRKLK